MPSLTAIALHNTLPGHDKLYVCRVDFVGGPRPFRVVAAWGPMGRPKAQAEQIKGEFSSLMQAEPFMERLVQEKINKGYVNVESSHYQGDWTKAQILSKVDMTRCCVEGQPQGRPAGIASREPISAAARTHGPSDEKARSRRTVNL